MDVKSYMNSDLKLIDGLVGELQDNITTWPSDKVLEKSGEMFDAFYRRFGLEDFILRHVKITSEMLPPLKNFLKVRIHFRENLENILMLHVDEPDFLAEMGHVYKAIVPSKTSESMIETESKFSDRSMHVTKDGLGVIARCLNTVV